MNDQALGIANVGQVREQLHRVDELPARLQAALDAEAHEAAEAFLQILHRQLVARVLRQPRIRHPAYQRMLLQVPRDLQRVLAMLALAQRQRLQPLQEQERVERTEARPDVAQQLHPRLDDERHVAQAGEVAEHLPELQPMIARVRLRELRELAVVPLELARIHNHPANRGAVAADILGRRGDNDVRPVINGPHQADAHGVIHHQRHAGVVRDLGQRLEVRHVQFGIADGLREDRPGLAA